MHQCIDASMCLQRVHKTMKTPPAGPQSSLPPVTTPIVSKTMARGKKCVPLLSTTTAVREFLPKDRPQSTVTGASQARSK